MKRIREKCYLGKFWKVMFVTCASQDGIKDEIWFWRIVEVGSWEMFNDTRINRPAPWHIRLGNASLQRVPPSCLDISCIYRLRYQQTFSSSSSTNSIVRCGSADKPNARYRSKALQISLRLSFPLLFSTKFITNFSSTNPRVTISQIRPFQARQRQSQSRTKKIEKRNSRKYQIFIPSVGDTFVLVRFWHDMEFIYISLRLRCKSIFRRQVRHK